MVIHDGNTKRTSGHDAAVADQTLEELRRLDAGEWKGKKWGRSENPHLPQIARIHAAGEENIRRDKVQPRDHS